MKTPARKKKKKILIDYSRIKEHPNPVKETLPPPRPRPRPPAAKDRMYWRG